MSRGRYPVDHTGRAAVITGGTAGIGREIARGLVRSGMTVIIGARDAGRAEAVRTDLSGEPGGGRVETLPLDVADMASVRSFAAEVTDHHPTLHLLINNAGAWFNERSLTDGGHERTLATNVMGPHLLAHLLLPPLRAGRPSRIVNIVSSATGNYDVDDLGWERRAYDGFKAYTQSKQALRMSTWKLAQRLDGTGVVANAVAPGFVRTTFVDHATGPVATMLRLGRIFAVAPHRGARGPLRVATAADLTDVNGRYFDRRREKDGGFRDQADLDRLERILDDLTGITRPD